MSRKPRPTGVPKGRPLDGTAPTAILPVSELEASDPLATELHQRFSLLYGGVIYDAMRFDLRLRSPFVLDHRIKPVWRLPGQQVLFGPALTCKGDLIQDESHLDDRVRIPYQI